ncbi:MAG TPA: sodium-translocating pyrophosphatase [Candidatus Azoamicus sp. OHIO2]
MLHSTILISLNIALSILICLYFIKNILSIPPGTAKMIEISQIISVGAKTYLKRQYKTIMLVSFFLGLLILIFFNKFYLYGFTIGVLLSAVSGYIGMLISVKANVRTTNAIRIGTLEDALKLSFTAGGITGLLVINLSLLGVFILYNLLSYFNLPKQIILNSLISLALGASLISIFARLGGGIFTKAADIGADLVGKLEIGIPEDDYRNPATIADNVGDNVGDCAGMAADLYETCCVTNIAAMALINIFCQNDTFLLFPLMLSSLSIFATILGINSIKLIKNNVMYSLYRTFFITIACSITTIFLYIILIFGWNINISSSDYIIIGKNVFLCSITGMLLTLAIMIITEYYTSTQYSPVKNIAKISQHGHAPNIIYGLAVSMESTALPILFIIIAMLVSYYLMGIIGIAIAAASMVSLAGIIITLDAYGPITDNAGGIAEMAKLSTDIRKKTDILDAVGNTTKAITKGYAIGSAGLGSLVLFITYTEDLKYYCNNLILNFSLENPFVISGLFFGGIIPYLFSSFSMKAVGNVASKVVNEIKLQFLNEKCIDENFKPNYTRVIDLLTKEAIKEMILPSLLPIFLPILLYSFIYMFFDKTNAFITLGAMLLGTIIIGIFLAISMTSGGGAWDNAKKYVEDGNYGGKNSITHKATITGDMVGDPYKDTTGPAINPLIKVSNIISLFIIFFIAKI